MTESPSPTDLAAPQARELPHGSGAAPRWPHLAVLAVVLAVALFSRTLRAGEGLPYLHRWGEPNIGSRSLDILRNGDLNPHWFRYGTPTLYLHAGVDVACYVWLCSQPEDSRHSIRSLDELETMADTKWLWTLSHPTFFHWNRLATYVIGAGTVLLTYLLGRMWLGPWAATAAAAVVTGAAAHIEVSTTIRSDMPGSLLALGTILAALAARESRRPGTFLFALFLAGLASSTKYNLVVVLVVPLAALFASLVLDARPDRTSDSQRRPWTAGPWFWFGALLMPAAGFLSGTPFALFDLATFLRDAGAEVTHYKLTGQGTRTIEPGLVHAWSQLRQFGENASWIAIALAAPGLAVLLRKRSGWLMLVFPVVYFLFMTRTTVDFHHNFVALYPFLAILAASGVQWLYTQLVRTERRLGAGFALLIAGLAGAHVAPGVIEGWQTYRTPETRTRAVGLVNELAADDDWERIGISKELRMHRIDLAELEVEHVVKPLAELLQNSTLDAIVCATAYKARQLESDKQQAQVARMNKLTPDAGLVGSVEGGELFLHVRSMNPGVSIFARGTGAE